MAKALEFFFDIGSPYSYLAATRLFRGYSRRGPLITWTPVLLGAIFKATGNTSPSAVSTKARWIAQDLSRCASRLEIGFRMPRRFPSNTLLAQRVLCAGTTEVPRLAMSLFAAYWRDGHDIEDPNTLVNLMRTEGFEGETLVEATKLPATKESLRANTDRALSLGVFGAPSFVVNGALFWGQDRLDEALEASGITVDDEVSG